MPLGKLKKTMEIVFIVANRLYKPPFPSMSPLRYPQNVTLSEIERERKREREKER